MAKKAKASLETNEKNKSANICAGIQKKIVLFQNYQLYAPAKRGDTTAVKLLPSDR